MKRVGIPGALLYYQYFPMWKTFFEELGAEVVTSPRTNQALLARGTSLVTADTCLPVKVYLGHVSALADKCDFIFVPAVRSMEPRVYNCSKFLGLPDMTRAVVPGIPELLEIDFDVNRGKGNLYQQIYRLGSRFTRNPLKIKRAAEAARLSWLEYRARMAENKLTPLPLLEELAGQGRDKTRYKTASPELHRNTIAVIGHPYLIYDDFINHRLIDRLGKMGSVVLTPEMIANPDLDAAIVRLSGAPYWTYEREVVGAGGYYLHSHVDGVIGVMAFGCGPDSLMMDSVNRHSGLAGAAPFMSLTIEEHTAEAGLVTRLEAFTDMIQRKKKKEVKICV